MFVSERREGEEGEKETLYRERELGKLRDRNSQTKVKVKKK